MHIEGNGITSVFWIQHYLHLKLKTGPVNKYLTFEGRVRDIRYTTNPAFHFSFCQRKRHPHP